ncbi:CoxG family protein [Novosphingobium album (ex Hu et al. 2023)]|uniref:SRPBCC family protein n=1 Tax=Novosphingobium album (ex Hu et al. 2023) TaxID=2930093 RepID=A0ABT0B771_9SPHN|nr:SRPBCC family protein [Novosphingobium album (ex Hu et al. 2023)]MCJ2180868.1 SRPBCC family protein [Novosphingobium album (ex Hu et al. 2023)]
MIETAQTVPVHVPVGKVWEHVKNIRNWAELMPGLQDCTIIDDDDSRWVLKVGVGAMVRTVKVAVHVDEWDGPERVFFSFKLQGDPVTGGGSYLAVPTSDGSVDMTLTLQVKGTGPMAPMWEAMGGPLLPKFAHAFAEQLARGIEEANGVSVRAEASRVSLVARFGALLGRLRRWIMASPSA